MSDVTIHTADSVALAAEVQRPEGPMRAVVVLLHGAADHRGRYAGVQRALVGAGFSVVSVDFRGHGRSSGVRGHIQSVRDYRADTAAMVALARSVAAGRPLFVWGHGLGGLVALDYALQGAQGLAGVVVSAPALQPAGVRHPLREMGLRLLAALRPQHRVRLPWRAVDLSHDPGVVAAYRADPWVQRTVTARWMLEIMRLMASVRAAAARFPVPLLILHGSDDPVYARSGSEAFHAACGHRDATLRIYEGSLHEVHHDRGRFHGERDLLRWLRERAMRRMPAASVAHEVAPSI